MDLQSRYIIGQNISIYTPFPRIKVLSQDENGKPISNLVVDKATATITIKDIAVDRSPFMPNCDPVNRRQISATLQYLRLIQVCKIIMINQTTTTDTGGRGDFNGF